MSENLIKARSTSQIDQRQLLILIHDSEENHKQLIDFMEKFHRNNFDLPRNITEYSRKDQITHILKNSANILKTMDVDIGIKKIPDGYISFPPIAGGVGLIATLPIINLSGSEEQKKEWIPRIQTGELIIAYAQTELAHGSDVQNLQTTAVYNETDETFTINTGSINAYKWWPGDLAQTANFTLVMARVYSKGKYRGLYPLFFQIRDLNTHKFLPGIEGGDIGPKLGFNSKDNAFMKFDNIKVPRTALQSRYVEVFKDGQFEIKGNILIFYSSMMAIRGTIIDSSPMMMQSSILIALRYSHFRSQFKPSKSSPERYIIEYQLQKAKIYPYLAKTYVMQLSAKKIKQTIEKMMQLVNEDENFSLLKEVHILCCFGKAQYSTWSNECFVTMMQACGGHGFLESAGISTHIDFHFSSQIYEGVNNVLLVQVGNELDKSFNKITKDPENEELLDQMSYFKNMGNLLQFKANPNRCRDHQTYLDMFSKTVIFLVQNSNLMRKNLLSGMNKKDLYDMKSGIAMIEAANIHGIYITHKFFNETISSISESPQKKALSKLGLICAITFMNQFASTIFSSGAADQKFFEEANQTYENLLEEINGDALILAEGFKYPEFYENQSALGNPNGKPYENMMDFAKKYAMLNTFDVHPTMLEYIAAQKEGKLMNPKL